MHAGIQVKKNIYVYLHTYTSTHTHIHTHTHTHMHIYSHLHTHAHTSFIYNRREISFLFFFPSLCFSLLLLFSTSSTFLFLFQKLTHISQSIFLLYASDHVSRLLATSLECGDMENTIVAFLLARQSCAEGAHVFPAYPQWFLVSLLYFSCDWWGHRLVLWTLVKFSWFGNLILNRIYCGVQMGNFCHGILGSLSTGKVSCNSHATQP